MSLPVPHFATAAWPPMLRRAGLVLLTVQLAACASSAISPQARDPELPDAWSQKPIAETAAAPAGAVDLPTEGWLVALDSPQLETLVHEAQAGNYRLGRQYAVVEELGQAITSAGADRWPGASLGVSGGRNMLDAEQGGRTYTESWQGSLDLSWELDIWGKLGDQQQRAELDYGAALATLRQQQIQLTADVATGWFDSIANTRLLALLQQRLDNVSSDLDSLEQGYRRGLNEARDVYLSRNTVADSRASLASQRQSLQESIAALQRLLARYPSGEGLDLDARLPELDPVAPAGAPALLLQRRPDIQQAWLSLLSADAGLAVAHKNRFPSLSLTGRAGTTSAALDGLVDQGLSSWSLGASLVQPLFEAGRLKSLEGQARARVVQAEKTYLDTVFDAFAEVESLLSAEQTLREQLQAQRESRDNANIAYDLSLQQYNRGLVDYTTVLEAQRRAFDAQTAAIQLHNRVIGNRISLYRALGGDFERRQPVASR
ncbi:efflux transporter outer membrane subunit [Haliea sp. E17]|uniref:efflux transporter outer membrane subunit n=1 Tax=Haliea sp. E17 TaxID=3401576 RepID=UPI003AACA9D0